MSSTTERSSLTDLIIVCGHAVFTGEQGEDWKDESKWLLQDFQRSDEPSQKRGEHETFAAHIAAGALAVSLNHKALLVFSGGRTTQHPRSEAEGYLFVLSSLKLLGADAKVRVCLEEEATDSYQNLLFSILRFQSETGRCPEHITVITHAFKERRFLDLHAPAIRWPASRLRIQGLNPPFTIHELTQTVENEHKRAYTLFADDPYGTGLVLAAKRRARNWPGEKPKDLVGFEPGVEGLLRWTGGDSGREIYPGLLPWSSTSIAAS